MAVGILGRSERHRQSTSRRNYACVIGRVARAFGAVGTRRNDPCSRPPRDPLIHVDCLVAADAPNGLICIGVQLAAFKLQRRSGDCGSNGISGSVTRGMMASQELPW
jgi:hypothetical protein